MNIFLINCQKGRSFRYLMAILFVAFLSTQSVFSQETKPISLKMTNQTIEQAVEILKSQYGISFTLSTDDVNLQKRISVNIENKNLNEALNTIFADENVNITIQNNKVRIGKKEQNSVSLVVEANQQSGIVYGKVVDEMNEPLVGVSVFEKGTTNGSVTSIHGEFSLKLNSDNKQKVVVISYLGMKPFEINVTKANLGTIVLKEDSKYIDEVVVIGYGTQKKSDLTGSIVRVNASEFATQTSTNLLEMLNGTVAGFESNQGTTSQGGGSMLIRGQKSLKASNDPLVVLNGVIFHGSIADINPADIETIDILKDASSAAVYGARSAAGVIIVTTKKGRSGKPSLSFNSEFGITSARMTMRALDPNEYIENRGQMLYQTYKTRPSYYYMDPYNLPEGVTLDEWLKLDQTISDDPTDMWLNRLNFTTIEKKNYLAGNTTDWFDQVYRTGIRQDYNINLSGGAEKFQYYVSGGYTDNQGVLQGDDYRVFRAKTNIDVQATNYLKFSVDVNYSRKIVDSQSANLEQTIRSSPYGDLYGEDGNYTFYPSDDLAAENPLVYTKNRIIYNPSDNLFATLSAELSLPWGIKYKPSFVSRMMWHRSYLFDPVTTPRGYNTNGFGQRLNTTNQDWMIDNLFTWQKTFAEKHSLDLTFLYNIEKNQYWYDFQSNSNFSPNGNLSWHALQAGTNPSINNDDQVNTGMAFMGRINYSYELRLRYCK